MNFTVLVLESTYEEKSLFKEKDVFCPTSYDVFQVLRACAIVLLCDKYECTIFPD